MYESMGTVMPWPCGPPHRLLCRERQAAPGKAGLPGRSSPAGAFAQAGEPGNPRPPTRQHIILRKGRDSRGGNVYHLS
ncbi:hypothetical protein JCM39194_22500 [Desulfotomaculum varum]